MSVARRVAFRCWHCSRAFDVLDLIGNEETASQFGDCCRMTLIDIASLLGTAVVTRVAPELVEHQRKFSDALANQFITSDNPALRRAAVNWRNIRAKG